MTMIVPMMYSRSSSSSRFGRFNFHIRKTYSIQKIYHIEEKSRAIKPPLCLLLMVPCSSAANNLIMTTVLHLRSGDQAISEA